MANVTDIIQYYVNLLIIQYHNKPKAMATIQLLADTMLSSGILLDIENAYDINEPSAVGAQLDIIGKYVGVDRFYSELVLTDYFSLIDYDETASLPSSPPRFGFSDYSTYDDFAYNGTLTYDDIIAVNNALFDSDFLILIKLKIIQNNSNFSYKSIDEEIFSFFGDTIRPEKNGNMGMVYFVDATITPLIKAVLFKKLLPKPMGVGLAVVDGITDLMFAFTDYSGYYSPYGFGFSDYSDYDTLSGQVLNYSQITEG